MQLRPSVAERRFGLVGRRRGFGGSAGREEGVAGLVEEKAAAGCSGGRQPRRRCGTEARRTV